MKILQFFKQRYHKILVKSWLHDHGIEKFEFDGSQLNVYQDVILLDRNLHQIPVNFYYVSGSFDCTNCGLTTLKNSPRYIDGDFRCGNNEITTLVGGPLVVNGAVDVSHNCLTNLIGAPECHGWFYCDNNELVSLKGAPKNLEKFYYNYNLIPREFFIGIKDNDILDILNIQDDYSIWNADNTLNNYRFQEMLTELENDKQTKISKALKSIIDELDKL